jgi:hypothetical protein
MIITIGRQSVVSKGMTNYANEIGNHLPIITLIKSINDNYHW